MTTTDTPALISYDLPSEIEAEIQNYEAHVRRFQRDEIAPLDFRIFRLQHGIYGQRQPDVHMVRVKIAYGGLNSEQLEILAEIAERYAPRQMGHITTRQDLQMHFVKLTDTPTVMRMLASVGLTTREACGNTVRNVTGDHLSGVGVGEAFDITPYAKAVAAHCLRLDVAQQLPRKFKPSFSASEHDYGLVAMHDIGFVARVRYENGQEQHGFKVVVGGGLGAAPHLADVLDEFVPANDVVRVTEAVLRVFNANGPRKNRNKARIKFYIRQVGIEQFRLQVQEELAKMLPASDPHYRQPSEYMSLEELAPQRNGTIASLDVPNTPEYREWVRTNVILQSQEGYVAVYATVPLGDLTVRQMRGVAEAARAFGDGQMRFSAQQALVFRWVRPADLPALYAALESLELEHPGAHRLVDVMACPGADTCALGITSSKGLASALRETIAARGLEDPLVEQMRIKISGCPNSCGHHHIADIGLQGVSMHADGRLAPAFNLLLGGAIDSDGAAIGRVTARIPVKRVPQVVDQLIDDYKAGRDGQETFRRYVERREIPYFRNLLEPQTATPKFSTNPLEFVDNGATKLFSLDEMGEGECAV